MALTSFFIEIDTRCNARCFYCDTGNKSRLPRRKSMDVELFTKIIDHALAIGIADKNTVIHLFDRGEPTLHPEISAILRSLNDRNLYYSISSNCGLAPKLDEDISLARLNRFTISMPGFSQASYDKIHRLPFEKVIRNIKSMLLDFRQRGYTGETNMSMHTYQFNLNELIPAEEFCLQNGIVFSPYYAFFADTKWAIDYANGQLETSVLERAKKELFLDKLQEEIARSPKNYRCPQYDAVTINERGELMLCCGSPRAGDDYTEGYMLGNFLEMDAETIIKAKTSASVCTGCIASGVAYMNHSTIPPDEYQPKQAVQEHTSIVEGFTDSTYAGDICTWLVGENVDVKIDNGIARIKEHTSYGLHRIMGMCEGGKIGDRLKFSILAKALGRKRIALELTDRDDSFYVNVVFDLEHGYQVDSRGPMENFSIAQEGDFYRISIEAITQSAVNFNFSLSCRLSNNAITYEGGKEAILVKNIQLTRAADVTASRSEPLLSIHAGIKRILERVTSA